MNVNLVTNPSSDERFRAFAQACMVGGALTPAGLQACLRTEFPEAQVSGGIAEMGAVRWYVYRYGTWVASIARLW